MVLPEHLIIFGSKYYGKLTNNICLVCPPVKMALSGYGIEIFIPRIHGKESCKINLIREGVKTIIPYGNFPMGTDGLSNEIYSGF